MISDGMESWTTYAKLPALKQIYLEDSYVLSIKSIGCSIEFQMDFVLREDHPFFCTPKPGEKYCYRRGCLKFRNVHNVRALLRSGVESVDAEGELDLGNIDSFVSNGSRYVLEGDWGKLDVEADEPTVAL